MDLFNLSTYLIPRAYIPPLTDRMKRRLSVLSQEQLLDNHDEHETEQLTSGLNGVSLGAGGGGGAGDEGDGDGASGGDGSVKFSLD